jgi:hypothetical protein
MSYTDAIPPAREREGLSEYVTRGHDKRRPYARRDYKHLVWQAAAWSGPRAELALRDVSLKAVAKPKRSRS